MNLDKLKELLALDDKLKSEVEALEKKYHKIKADIQIKYDTEINVYNTQLSQKEAIVEEEAKKLAAEAEKKIKIWYEKEKEKAASVDSGKLSKAKVMVKESLIQLVS